MSQVNLYRGFGITNISELAEKGMNLPNKPIEKAIKGEGWPSWGLAFTPEKNREMMERIAGKRKPEGSTACVGILTVTQELLDRMKIVAVKVINDENYNNVRYETEEM